MQWTYDILGTTADYNPQNAWARITSTSANSARRNVKQKKNYVLENLKLGNNDAQECTLYSKWSLKEVLIVRNVWKCFVPM